MTIHLDETSKEEDEFKKKIHLSNTLLLFLNTTARWIKWQFFFIGLINQIVKFEFADSEL